jgi:hypothetical protein
LRKAGSKYEALAAGEGPSEAGGHADRRAFDDAAYRIAGTPSRFHCCEHLFSAADVKHGERSARKTFEQLWQSRSAVSSGVSDIPAQEYRCAPTVTPRRASI